MNNNLLMEMDFELFNNYYCSKKVNTNQFFSELLPKYNKPLRESQLEMAIEIESALQNNKKFIAEAEVGTGKTFAYIIPAYNSYLNQNSIFASKKPILISTATIVLQEQLIEKDLEFIKNVLVKEGYSRNIDFRYCLLKGKENFLCEERLQNIIDCGKVNEIIEQISDLYDRKNCFDRNDFPFVDNSTWEKVSVKTCSNKCKYRDCKYKEYKNRVKNSNCMFYVCNHHYLLSCLKDDKFNIKDKYSMVIIDEAHNLENAAFTILGDNKNIFSFRNVVEKIRKKISRSEYIRQRLLTRVNNLDRKIDEFFELFESNVVIHSEVIEVEWKYEIVYTDELKRISADLKHEIYDIYNNEVSSITQAASTRYGSSKEDDELESEVSNIISFLNALIDSKNNIYWAQYTRLKSRYLLYLYYMPKNINDILCNNLFKKDVPIVLTSATLSDTSAEEYGFDYFENCVGIDKIYAKDYKAPISKKSTFNYKENCALYIEKDLKYVKSDDDKLKYIDYLEKKSDRIYEIIESLGGRCLILFTSYESLNFTVNKIRKRIEDTLNIKCYVQGELSNKELYFRFKNEVSSCLFGTGSFWEGIDIPGESLSCVIIDKLPFPVIDPIIKLKMEKYQYDNIFEVLLPEMVIKLRQGVGRLIRDINDVGVIAILDSRASDKYYDKVKNSLPKCREINSVEDMVEFIYTKRKTELKKYKS